MYGRLVLLFFLILSVAMALPSCKRGDTGGENIIFDLNDEFNLFVWEQLVPGEQRQVGVSIASIKEYPCENYGLKNMLSYFGNDGIQLAVTGLLEPADCIVGPAPAQTDVSLGALNEGNYKLKILLAGKIENEGVLSIYPDYYELNINQDNGILLPANRVNRIPDQTIWGYVGYDAAPDVDSVQQLMTDLSEKVETFNYAPGIYSSFRVNEAGKVFLTDEEISSNYYQTFFFHIKTSEADLIEALEQTYCPQYKNTYHLKVYTSSGRVIECG